MQKRGQTMRPEMELLEDRTVPATLRLLSGSLYISNPVNAGGATNVELRAVANNQFEVYDNGAKIATVNVGGTIYYTGSNLPDTLTVNLQGNNFTGNLTATMGNGNDAVDVFATGGALLGNVNVQTGYGDDTVNLNSNGAAMNFGGTIAVTDQLGVDTVNLGNAAAATNFLGNVQLSGVNTVNAGQGQADLIARDLSVLSLTENVPLSVTFADNFAVNGRTTVRGTSAADAVILGVNSFGGAAEFLLGSGDDAFTLTADGATFNGNLTLDLGLGSNSIDLAPAFTVGGSMTLRNAGSALATTSINGTINGSFTVELGDGDYSLSTADTALVGGNFSIRAGNGTSTFGLQNTTGGDLSVILGNGSGNSTQIFGPATIGGRLIYRGGNGGTALSPNTLVLGASGLYNLDVLFGSGDDCLTFAGAGISLTGRADGGGGIDGLGDTTNVTLLPTLTLASFETTC